MIDTNVNLFRWPFRRVVGDEPAELVRQLRKKGVTQAWAGSFEALLCRDIAGVNMRLAAACREQGANFLVPFGCVNPKLPDWQEDLRRCHEVHRMAGIRLYPNYNGYVLTDPVVAELLSQATARKLVVQIALSMEDPRTQFPLMQVAPVDPAPLAEILSRMPNLRLVLLNAGHWAGENNASIQKIAQAANAHFDIAMNEGVGGLERLIAATSPEQVVFGSHYPFYYFEAALLKVRGAGLPREQEAALLEGNARALLKTSAK